MRLTQSADLADAHWHKPNGEYVLKSNNLCPDDPAFRTTKCTRLEIWHGNGGANQRWSLPG